MVNLNINNVSVELGSTAFLNAMPNETMRIAMLEGQAMVTVEGNTVSVVAGFQAEIPLDENGLANGVPELSPFNSEDFATLPLDNLDELIELPAVPSATSGDGIMVNTNQFCYAGREAGLPCQDYFLTYDVVPGEVIQSQSPNGTRTFVYSHNNVYVQANAEDADGNSIDLIGRTELTIVSPDLITIELSHDDGTTFPLWYYVSVADDD